MPVVGREGIRHPAACKAGGVRIASLESKCEEARRYVGILERDQERVGRPMRQPP